VRKLKLYNKVSTKIKIFSLIVILLILFITLDRSNTAPILDSDNVIKSNSISSLERIDLGGINQSVLIRGHDINNPVLLFIHGGPGYSTIPLVSSINSNLEEHFIVVNWDQRGTGKSLFWGMNKDSISMDLIEQDLHQLVGILKSRFNKNKILLVGHSWGSIIGLKSISKHPKDYSAYIGVGQVINSEASDKIIYDFCLKSAIKENNEKAIKQLEGISDLISRKKMNWNEAFVLYNWLNYYEGGYKGRSDIKNLNKLFIEREEYSHIDLLRKRVGISLSLLFLKEELEEVNFYTESTKYEIPIFFCLGKYDYQTPSVLVEEYFNIIKSPYKEIMLFNNSAHYPLFEEPDKFNNYLIHGVLPKIRS